MILQRLAEHYDRLASNRGTAGEIAPPGFSWQKISFCVVLQPDGRFQSLQALLEPEGNRLLPRQMLVPGEAKSSGSGLNPGLLWDNSMYMLGFKADDSKPDRTRASFEAFRKRHLETEKRVSHPWFTAVCSYLRSWSPQQALQYAEQLKECTQNFGVFRIVGERQFVHEAVGLITVENDALPQLGTCLVTGQHGIPIARLHEPKIKGVRGSQSAGALLVSFNDEAYESYGKSQSYNAPVGAKTTFKYANALNRLLDPRNGRRILIGDSTVVFWAEKATTLEDVVSDLFGNEPISNCNEVPEARERLRQTRQFLTQLRDATEATKAIDEENAIRFFILGLSPNNARLSVRLWIDTSVAELKERLGQHLRDLALHAGREEFPPSLREIVAATGRADMQQRRFKGFDTENVPPMLAGALARAVLAGGPYPLSLLARLIGRIRADGAVHPHRCAAIKGCLVRNSRLRGNPKEVSVALDVNQTEPAYNVGRLFALLEKIQTDSVEGELNATIKDRYFSSASSTPAVVFPRLLRLNQHHLAKLSMGTKIFYEKLMGEVISKLESFPRHLSLEDQGQFAIGYFHQRQDLFTSRKSALQGDPQ